MMTKERKRLGERERRRTKRGMSGGKGEGRSQETAAYHADGSIIGTKLPRKGSRGIKAWSKQTGRLGSWKNVPRG